MSLLNLQLQYWSDDTCYNLKYDSDNLLAFHSNTTTFYIIKLYRLYNVVVSMYIFLCVASTAVIKQFFGITVHQARQAFTEHYSPVPLAAGGRVATMGQLLFAPWAWAYSTLHP